MATNAAWIGSRSSRICEKPSRVITAWPSAAAASTMSDETSRPSRSTAPAPVSPESEPNLTLKQPRRRNTVRSTSYGSHVAVVATPLRSMEMVRLIAALP